MRFFSSAEKSAELLGWSIVRRPSSSVVRPQLHFRLLFLNRWLDFHQTWWWCALGGSLPSLFKWFCSSDFWIFYEFFCSFFEQILKNLLLRNRLANCFEITQGDTWEPLDLNLFSRWRCDFFQFFNEFLCVFAIFDFFSKTDGLIIVKLGRNVPQLHLNEVCSLSSAANISWFFTNFLICVSVNKHTCQCEMQC